MYVMLTGWFAVENLPVIIFSPAGKTDSFSETPGSSSSDMVQISKAKYCQIEKQIYSAQWLEITMHYLNRTVQKLEKAYE